MSLMPSNFHLPSATNLITVRNGFHADVKQAINALFMSLCDGFSPVFHGDNYTIQKVKKWV